ncbi:Aspartic proteinase nepenthesin-1 [Glycine max]|nr:Aspartic proteinase nepenthesin-1 [Glycine max]
MEVTKYEEPIPPALVAKPGCSERPLHLVRASKEPISPALTLCTYDTLNWTRQSNQRDESTLNSPMEVTITTGYVANGSSEKSRARPSSYRQPSISVINKQPKTKKTSSKPSHHLHTRRRFCVFSFPQNASSSHYSLPLLFPLHHITIHHHYFIHPHPQHHHHPPLFTHHPSSSNSHPFHTLQLAVSTSITRAHHLKNHNNPSSLKTLVHPKTYGGYSIDLKFGTPPQTFPFVLDTGSSLVWLPCYSHYLCSKCNSFSNNNTPKFIPKDSFSSKFVGCRNPKCAWVFGSDVTSHCCKLAKAAFSNNNNCSQTCPAYTVQYGLGSTAGFLLSENLNFPAKNVSDFLVGCSVVSVYQPGGIAGFGRGEESLPAQMNLTRFSYCLLSHQFDESPENSDLVMEATNSGEGKKNQRRQLHGVSEKSVNKKARVRRRVRVPRRMLEPDVNGDGGFIVDSGSTLTFMERPIFDLVAEEFVKQVNYTRARELEKQFGLSPCFVLAGGAETASFPEMRFEFRGGAKMRLPVANYFSLVGKGDVACLTIVSDDVAGQGGAVGPAVILGNYQQQNFYVECDLENERFGFRSQSCQKRVY